MSAMKYFATLLCFCILILAGGMCYILYKHGGWNEENMGKGLVIFSMVTTACIIGCLVRIITLLEKLNENKEIEKKPISKDG